MWLSLGSMLNVFSEVPVSGWWILKWFPALCKLWEFFGLKLLVMLFSWMFSVPLVEFYPCGSWSFDQRCKGTPFRFLEVFLYVSPPICTLPWILAGLASLNSDICHLNLMRLLGSEFSLSPNGSSEIASRQEDRRVVWLTSLVPFSQQSQPCTACCPLSESSLFCFLHFFFYGRRQFWTLIFSCLSFDEN